MALFSMLIVLAIVCAVLGIASAMAMTAYVSRKGKDVSFLLVRLFIFSYISQYKEITLQEQGKVGPLFYSFLIGMNLALVTTITAFLIR